MVPTWQATLVVDTSAMHRHCLSSNAPPEPEILPTLTGDLQLKLSEHELFIMRFLAAAHPR